MRAAGSGRRAALFAARSTTALYRLLDVLQVFAGDPRVTRRFTMVPGSDFDGDLGGVLAGLGAGVVDWEQAVLGTHDLVVMASPKGEVSLLGRPRLLVPHGAGFNKSVPGEGSAGVASGLDPAYLEPHGSPVADAYAMAHAGQLALLRGTAPRSAALGHVVGDPTLDRMLASAHLRQAYRHALGTGDRKLVVLCSTWGEHSLLRKHPRLPGELCNEFPVDSYQFALLVHPNEYSRTGRLDLAAQQYHAVDAGLLLPAPMEEWAAVLVAADAVVTDHGSTALYAAALGHPIVGVGGDGGELLAGSPMSELLRRVPRLRHARMLDEAVKACAPAVVSAAADAAFDHRRQSLAGLRDLMYGMLALDPPATPAEDRLLPVPRVRSGAPGVLSVRAEVFGPVVRVDRFPARTETPGHHLAAEAGRAAVRELRSAAVVFAHALAPVPTSGASSARTADGWAAHVLAAYPECRLAAVVADPEHCLLYSRALGAFTIRIHADHADGRLHLPDPAAVVSAAHLWLHSAGRTDEFVCAVGVHRFRVTPTAGARHGARTVVGV